MPSCRSALAVAPTDPGSDRVRLALLGEIVTERGLGFSTIQDARSVQAEEIIRARSFNLDVGSQIVNLSNGYTDELVSKVRGFIARLARR